MTLGLMVALSAAFGCSGAVSERQEFPDTPTGTLDGPCTAGGLCDGGLICLGDICRPTPSEPVAEGESVGEGEGEGEEALDVPPHGAEGEGEGEGGAKAEGEGEGEGESEGGGMVPPCLDGTGDGARDERSECGEGEGEGEPLPEFEGLIQCPGRGGFAGDDVAWLASAAGLHAVSRLDLSVRPPLAFAAGPVGRWIRMLPHGMAAVVADANRLRRIDLGRRRFATEEGLRFTELADPAILGLAVAPGGRWAAVAWREVLAQKLAVFDLDRPSPPEEHESVVVQDVEITGLAVTREGAVWTATTAGELRGPGGRVVAVCPPAEGGPSPGRMPVIGDSSRYLFIDAGGVVGAVDLQATEPDPSCVDLEREFHAPAQTEALAPVPGRPQEVVVALIDEADVGGTPFSARLVRVDVITGIEHWSVPLAQDLAGRADLPRGYDVAVGSDGAVFVSELGSDVLRLFALRDGAEALQVQGPAAANALLMIPAIPDDRCDRRDDDCDGETDEGFGWEGLALSEDCDGIGVCGQGVVECRADGDAATCSSNPDGSGYVPVQEGCNGLDDDCDGEVDEAGPGSLGRMQEVRPAAAAAGSPSVIWAGERVAVAWHEDVGGVDQIRVAVFDAGAGRLSIDQRVTDADSWRRYPDIAWNGEKLGLAWIAESGPDWADEWGPDRFRELDAQGQPLGVEALAPPAYPNSPAAQGPPALIFHGDRWLIGGRFHGRHLGAEQRDGYFFLSWRVSPGGEVEAGFNGNNLAGSAMGDPALISLGPPHDRIAAGFVSASPDLPTHLWLTTDLAGAGIPSAVDELDAQRRSEVDLAWQAPAGRVGLATVRRPPGGDPVVELVRANLDRSILGITELATHPTVADVAVVWDGSRYMVIYEAAPAPDAPSSVYAVAVDEVGEAGPERLLTHAAGSHTQPAVAWGERGYAVVWTDVADPETGRGAISLLVGPLGCD